MRLFYGELVWYHDCLVHKKNQTDEPNLETSNLKLFCSNEFNHRVTESTEFHKENKPILRVTFVHSVALW